MILLLFFLSSCSSSVSNFNEPSSQSKVLKGEIESFQCGDNCYLYIKLKEGRTQTALCLAKACIPWNQSTEIPKTFIGKKVSAIIGKGTRADGSGAYVDEYDAILELVFE